MVKQPGAVFFLVGFFSLVFISCSKYPYFLSTGEWRRLASDAKEPGVQAFIFTNGDTVKGKTVTRRASSFSKKVKYVVDGKTYDGSDVWRYQDKYGYHTSDCLRIFRNNDPGAMSLYLCKIGSTSSPGGSGQMPTTSNIYGCSMEIDGILVPVTLNRLRETVQNCPAAAAQIDKEFKKEWYIKHPESNLSDYQALLRIAEVYNNCK